VSWLERAIGCRQYFESVATSVPEFREGTNLVHRWIQMLGGATAAWATQVYGELDATMARDHHDGASGWGMFRNDVTTWLATWVRDHGRPEDRAHLVAVAGCVERYLRALGTGHASVTAPLAARWKAALEHDDAAALHALLDEARGTHEMHTAGAGGVLPLMEASARVIAGATLQMSTEIRPAPPQRSGEPLATPITVRVLPRAGGEWTRRFEAVPIAIGRAESADVRFDDPFVARAHARIERDGEALVIFDLRSDNQTFLWSRAVDREALQQGDVLVFGANLVVVSGA